MVYLMRTRASFIIGAISLAICVICPLVEMFDRWDHTLQTGNDTEYIFVLLALCVGALFALSRLIVVLSPSFSGSSVGSTHHSVQNSTLFLFRPVAMASASGSPPLNLRI